MQIPCCYVPLGNVPSGCIWSSPPPAASDVSRCESRVSDLGSLISDPIFDLTILRSRIFKSDRLVHLLMTPCFSHGEHGTALHRIKGMNANTLLLRPLGERTIRYHSSATARSCSWFSRPPNLGSRLGSQIDEVVSPYPRIVTRRVMDSRVLR
jgi:hypothetical protein